mmetsp:Transcript_151358/g.263846  ORF Transcript_151358/g.263846 Transcript_151358/m.263846 type:complete len:167 (-) Transcript_151358:27-527(-)
MLPCLMHSDSTRKSIDHTLEILDEHATAWRLWEAANRSFEDVRTGRRKVRAKTADNMSDDLWFAECEVIAVQRRLGLHPEGPAEEPVSAAEVEAAIGCEVRTAVEYLLLLNTRLRLPADVWSRMIGAVLPVVGSGYGCQEWRLQLSWPSITGADRDKNSLLQEPGR